MTARATRRSVAGVAFSKRQAVAESVVHVSGSSRGPRIESFLAAAVGQLGVTCAFLFMVLGVYGNAMSFVEVLPSSLLVALGFSARFLAFAQPKTNFRLGMFVLAIAFVTAVLGIFLAFVLSVFPKLIAFQWQLLKLL